MCDGLWWCSIMLKRFKALALRGICGSEASLVYIVRPCVQTNRCKVLNVTVLLGPQ